MRGKQVSCERKIRAKGSTTKKCRKLCLGENKKTPNIWKIKKSIWILFNSACTKSYGEKKIRAKTGFKNAQNEFYIFFSNPRRNKANINCVNHCERLTTICSNQFSLFINIRLISASDSFHVTAVGRLLCSSESLMCIFLWTIFCFLESTVISCLCLYLFLWYNVSPFK